MSAPHVVPGQLLGQFRLVEEIGAGGMGVVYRAWDTRLERDVAVKILNPNRITDTAARRRFRREALILSRLNHPNIEAVYDFHSENGIDYLVLEYVAGTSLSDRLAAGALPEAEVLAIGIQLAKGLAVAHGKHIIHRDLKPSNLRVTPENTLKILDFGLAQLFFHDDQSVVETLTIQSPLAGTPPYLSPEQVEGKEPDLRSDIYSAGVVLYELSTGSRPFPYHGPMLLNAIVHSAPPQPRSSNKDISHPFEAVILKCLNKDPKLRYHSANELLQDLEDLTRDSGSHSLFASHRGRYLKRLLPLTVLVLLVVLGVGIRYRNGLLNWLGITTPNVSLAVLPLQNHTGNPSLDYLAIGISEALTNDLSRMPGLQVTAQEVARRYGGDTKDLLAVGRALNVTSIVDGSIIDDGNGKLRIPIELINTTTGHQIWGQIYEAKLAQLVELQHQISTDVAYRLKVKSDANIEARLKRQYSTNPTTYDFYLKGRFHLAQRSPDALQEAITDFQRALDHDSQYAPAYAGLADCYTLLAYYGVENPIPLFRKAVGYSQQALELDSTLGEAYTSRALASTFLDFDWQGAESDYKRAIELNPNYLAAHTWYGLALLMPLGRRAEAAAQLAYAAEADPHSLVMNVSLATLDYLSGSPDKSIELIQSRVPLTFEPARQVLALDYVGKDVPDKAISLLASDSLPDELLRQRAVPLGIAYARSHQRAKALEQLKIATQAVAAGSFLAYETAALYTVLDEHQKALDMLDLAYARRESNVVFLNVDPLLTPLHSEPRFQKLLQKMNML
jgi:serine/threonine protein kinase